jgi:hypothetical protein
MRSGGNSWLLALLGAFLLLSLLLSVDAALDYQIDGKDYKATMSQLWYEGYWREVRSC